MANARLFYTNLLASTPATLTPLTEATGYDADELLTSNYAEVWRSTAAGAAAQTIVADFGAAVSITSCAIGNVNLRSTATAKIQGHTADSWGSPDVDETIPVTHLDGYARSAFHSFSSASKRYWRLSLLDDGNPDGFLEVGSWFLGTTVTLTDNFDSNNTRRLIRNNVTHRTEYNQTYVYTRDFGWAFDLSWMNAQVDTRDELRALNHAQEGNATPFFLVIDPTAPADVYYVRMTGPYEERRVHYDRYSLRATFKEEEPGLIVPR